MPIFQSTNYVLVQPAAGPNVTDNNPIIGYDNIVPNNTLTADTAQSGFPAVNLATPLTYQKWKGEAQVGTQYVTLMMEEIATFDYLAVASHNFGSSLHAVSVEVAETLDSNGDPDWVEIVTPRLLVDDSPILFRFNEVTPLGVRLGLADGVDDPFAGVLYVGSLLVLPRRIYVGHRPMNYNRQTDHLAGKSETGEFLGRIIRKQFTQGAIEMSKIPPLLWREEINPWVVSAEETPFFFAWRPGTYPNEVAYAWAMEDGTMTNELPNGMVQMSMSLQGIVR